MPRPQKNRIVNQPPLFNSFKPSGMRSRDIHAVCLSLDEYEAIRLADHLGLEHAGAAERMEVSRSTFTRLIEKARKKVAGFLVEGKQLTIEGGRIHFQGNIFRCNDCVNTFKSEFDNNPFSCPECGSENIMDLAGQFGHGRCCHGRHRNGR